MNKDNNERPTPITDESYKQREGESGFHHNVRKREAMQDLERQLAEALEQRDRLAAWSERLLEIIDHPPTPNCSCHLSPPCNDCVDYGGLREAIQEIEESLAQVERSKK